jgi:hypothetical protein
MRKVTLVLCAVALVFGSFAMVAQADSQQSFFNNFCKWFDDLGFDNHGQCVSFFAKELNNNGPAEFCKSTFFGVEFWDLLGFKNRGECVSFFRH